MSNINTAMKNENMNVIDTLDALEWPLRKVTLPSCDATMAYIDEGIGEPIVLIHGYPQNHLCWRHQISFFLRTGKYRIIAMDLLGWGASDRKLAIAPDFENEVRRLGEFIELLKLPKFNLFTHDYGGLLGLAFVERNPQRICRFAIMDSRAHSGFTYAYSWFFSTICTMASWPGSHWLLTQLPAVRMHKLFLQQELQQGCFDESLLDKYIGWMDTLEGRQWFAHFYQYWNCLPHPELFEGLTAVTCPVTIVWGKNDPYFPVTIAEELHHRISNSSLTIIEEARHYVMEECPEKVTQVLLELLQKPARHIVLDQVSY